jgi:hypothetical protein
VELAGLRPAQRSEAIKASLGSDAGRVESPRPTGLRCFAAATPEGVCLALPIRIELLGRGQRPKRLASCVAGALAVAAGLGVPRADSGELDLEGAEWNGFVALRVASADPSEVLELLPLSLDEQAAHLDRMEPVAIVVPAGSLDDTEPIEADWLARAELVARLDGYSAATRLDPAVLSALEAYRGLLHTGGSPDSEHSAHDDPSPERRVLRRILRRLDGMGKYGGYHTEFSHLARGFPGHERALALEAGEALLRAGILAEKPSVGQRHVSLVAARTDEIRQLIAGTDVHDRELDRFLLRR